MFYPILEMPDWKDDTLGFSRSASPILTEAACESGFLLGWLELCQEQSVSNADLVGIERLDHCRDKLRQSGAAGDVGRILAYLGSDLLNGVLRFLQFEKRVKTLRLL